MELCAVDGQSCIVIVYVEDLLGRSVSRRACLVSLDRLFNPQLLLLLQQTPLPADSTLAEDRHRI